ncbi:Thiamine-monophosphate kinase [Candidatus Electronema halotolerans]
MKERELIAWIQGLTEQGGKGLLQGIGDDCAVIEKNADTVWLLTMDSLIESVHFNCAWHPPELLGRKAVAVNCSDIAAMGGQPLFALIGLGLPADFSSDWAGRLMQGLTQACQEQGCLLIGGDTVRSPEQVMLTLTVIGEMRKEQVLYRHKAQPGDTIWVSGPLGCSAAGLALLQAGKSAIDLQWRDLILTHLDPQPQTGLGRLLAASTLVHAMMDMSDGLATDLAHLCEQSKVGAVIEADLLPGAAELTAAADLLGQDPLTWMLSGGEDYTLLFTATAHATEAVQVLTAEQGWRIHPVGSIRAGQGLRLIRSDGGEEDVLFQGFDHFPREVAP